MTPPVKGTAIIASTPSADWMKMSSSPALDSRCIVLPIRYAAPKQPQSGSSQLMAWT
jgi:hypothetical protein